MWSMNLPLAGVATDVASADLLGALVCPVDRGELCLQVGQLACAGGHSFGIQDGVPVLTAHPRCEPTPRNMGPCVFTSSASIVDPFVNDWIVNTNGNLYRKARGNLRRYPIPHWPFGPGEGKLLLDLGCGWGRWCVAASRAGYQAVGVDIHLDALCAAKRVAGQLRVTPDFLCSDASFLPLKPATVDVVFSYSVLQHLDRPKVAQVLCEIARILRPGGVCYFQLANRFGTVSLYRQGRRGFREARPDTLEMHYWSKSEIASALRQAGFRLVSLRADGFFSLNPQRTDLDLLPLWGKGVVLASLAGQSAATAFPVLTRLADSLWIEARHA